MSAPGGQRPGPPLAPPTPDSERFDLRGLRGRAVLVSFLRHAG